MSQERSREMAQTLDEFHAGMQQKHGSAHMSPDADRSSDAIQKALVDAAVKVIRKQGHCVWCDYDKNPNGDVTCSCGLSDLKTAVKGVIGADLTCQDDSRKDTPHTAVSKFGDEAKSFLDSAKPRSPSYVGQDQMASMMPSSNWGIMETPKAVSSPDTDDPDESDQGIWANDEGEGKQPDEVEAEKDTIVAGDDPDWGSLGEALKAKSEIKEDVEAFGEVYDKIDQLDTPVEGKLDEDDDTFGGEINPEPKFTSAKEVPFDPEMMAELAEIEAKIADAVNKGGKVSVSRVDSILRWASGKGGK